MRPGTGLRPGQRRVRSACHAPRQYCRNELRSANSLQEHIPSERSVKLVAVRRLLFLTCAIVFADTIFYAVLVPLVPHFAEEFGLSKSAVGILSGAFGVGVVVGSAPGAYLASRVGVKATAVLGLVILAATSLPFGFVGEAWVLAVLRFGEGFGSALSWISAFTWVVTRAPQERRGQMIGTLLSAAVIATFIGPAIGGAADAIGLVPVFVAVAILGMLVAVWALLTPAPPAAGVSPDFRALGGVFRPALASGIWLVFLSPLLFAALAVLSPLEFSRLGWGAAAIAAVFVAGAAVEAVVHPSAGRWADKSGYGPPIYTGLIGSIGLLLMLPWLPGPWSLAILVVLAAALFNFALTPGTMLLTNGAEKIGIGAALAFGLTNFAWASGYATGASMGGLLAQLGGDALSYLSLAAVCGASLLLIHRSLWRA